MKLSELKTDSIAHSVIVYGPPKSGKTDLVVRGLTEHYNVLYIDNEGGVTTLLKLPEEKKEKVSLVRIFDTKENPVAIDTMLKLASGNKYKVCLEHGKVNCPACLSKDKNSKEELFQEWELNSLPTEDWVVVFDSFTQLTSSAQAHVTRKLDMEKDKMTFDHWRAQAVLLEKFLDYLQNAKYNCVLITHEMGIEQEDGTEKIMPSGGSKNFARNVSKYFDHIAYVTVRNKKHNAYSATTAQNRVLTGSRTDVVIDMSKPESFCSFFGKKVSSSTEEKKPVSGLRKFGQQKS